MSTTEGLAAASASEAERATIASRNLFELLPLGIIVTNDDDKIIEANGTAATRACVPAAKDASWSTNRSAP